MAYSSAAESGTASPRGALVWDAWNRLVNVSAGGTVVAEYGYDALFRRISKKAQWEGALKTRHFYYSDQWQILEEYVESETNPEVRYWYGIRDINDIARRQRYSSGTTLQDDFYALRETMNVVALVNSNGTVTQRMACDAFGNTRFLTAAWAGTTDGADWAMLFHAHYRDYESGLYQMRIKEPRSAGRKAVFIHPAGSGPGADSEGCLTPVWTPALIVFDELIPKGEDDPESRAPELKIVEICCTDKFQGKFIPPMPRQSECKKL